MKNEEFVFNLVNRILTNKNKKKEEKKKEKYENYLGLASSEEIKVIRILSNYLKQHRHKKFSRIYFDDNGALEVSEDFKKYIKDLGLTKKQFPDGVPTSLRSYMRERDAKEPDFRFDILEKLESTNCSFTNRTIKDDYDEKINYFIELKIELDNNVIPAIASVKDGSFKEDDYPIEELERWLKDNLNVLEYDLDDPSVRLNKSIMWKDYPKKGLTFEEKISLEIIEFSMVHGLKKVGVCKHCGNYFLWSRMDSKYCHTSCKSRKSEANIKRKKKNNINV